MAKQDSYSSQGDGEVTDSTEAGKVRARLEDIKRRGGRAEYAFTPGDELTGRPPVFYVPDQLVTTLEHANLVHRLLEEWHGKCGGPRPLVEYDNELVAFTVEGDSLHVATAIKQAAAKLPDAPRELPVGPLHILTPAP